MMSTPPRVPPSTAAGLNLVLVAVVLKIVAIVHEFFLGRFLMDLATRSRVNLTINDAMTFAALPLAVLGMLVCLVGSGTAWSRGAAVVSMALILVRIVGSIAIRFDWPPGRWLMSIEAPIHQFCEYIGLLLFGFFLVGLAAELRRPRLVTVAKTVLRLLALGVAAFLFTMGEFKRGRLDQSEEWMAIHAIALLFLGAFVLEAVVLWKLRTAIVAAHRGRER